MLVFPEDVSYKFGRARSSQKRYFISEIHLDNPEKEAGLVFETGVKILYTEKPR